MGQVIKTRTITEDQLEALTAYCFAVNSVEIGERFVEDARDRVFRAMDYLNMCAHGLRTSEGLIPSNLDRVVREFGITDSDETNKNTIAMDLIRVYLDHPGGEIPTLGEIKHKTNVIVRRKNGHGTI